MDITAVLLREELKIMATKTYSVFKDAMFPVEKILGQPFNIALSELWQGHTNTYQALADLQAHSVIWDLTEIKKIYSLINFHVLYQNEFACEFAFRDGFEGDIDKQPLEHEYHILSRRAVLLLMLILADDVLLDDYPSKNVIADGTKTIIKTENYTYTLENPAIGMPGTRFEFKVGDQFELRMFAYKSND